MANQDHGRVAARARPEASTTHDPPVKKRDGSGQRGKKLLARCKGAGLPHFCRHLVLTLQLYEGPDRVAFPSVDLLADDTGWTRNTVRKALRQLEAAGLLAKLAPRSGDAATRYRLADTARDPAPARPELPSRWKPKDATMGQRVTHGVGHPVTHGAPPANETMGHPVSDHGSPHAPAVGHPVTPKDWEKDELERSTQSSRGAVAHPPDASAQVVQLARPRKVAAKRATAPKPPLPFRALRAYELARAAAGGRLLPIEPRDLAPGVAIALEKLVRAYPTEAEWTAAGATVAAGYLGYMTDLGPAWLAKHARGLMASARSGAPVGAAAPAGRKPRHAPAPVSASHAAGADLDAMLDAIVAGGAR